MAEKKEYVCEICGKRFEGKRPARAYAGHMWLAHFKKVGTKGKMEALEKRIKDLEAKVIALEAENERLKAEKASLISSFEKETEELKKMVEKELKKALDKATTCPKCGKKFPKEHRLRHDFVYGWIWQCLMD